MSKRNRSSQPKTGKQDTEEAQHQNRNNNGVIIGAIISAAAIIIAALITYFGNVTPTSLTIEATQTAEVLRTAIAMTNQDTQASQTSVAVNNQTTETQPPAVDEIFSVSSVRGWQDTSVYVNDGERVEITVISGEWSGQIGQAPYTNGEGDLGYRCGKPTCAEPLPNSPTGALIGQIGNMIFEIGSGTIIISQDNGNLRLRMNDADMRDNEGYLQVKISK